MPRRKMDEYVIYNKLYEGMPLSRREKKFYLGKKISRKKLREMLSSVVIMENKYPEPATIKPYPFCPKCGCVVSISSGEMAQYPESYQKGYCARCNFLVWQVDNSPIMYALECKEYNYEIN